MQTACCQFDMSDLFSSKQTKLMDMAKLHCSNYKLAAAPKLKITTFALTSLALFTLAAVKKRFLSWHTIVQTLIYTRHNCCLHQ